MDNIEFVNKLEELNELSWRIQPEQWDCVCASYGMNVAESQNLYFIFRIIAGRKGGISTLLENKPSETINLVLEIANKAKALWEDCYRQDFRLHGFREDHKAVVIYWEKETESGLEQFRKEFKLNEPLSYVYISNLVRDSKVKIKAIINQVDTIHSLTDYEGEEKRNDPNLSSLRIYDGDVFCCYNQNLSDYWNHPRENGLYIATEDGYRKLLYTVGKGYLKRGKPNTDDDYEIDYGENRFTEYIMTLSHSWNRIGNVNVDASFLLEKPKQENDNAYDTEGC